MSLETYKETRDKAKVIRDNKDSGIIYFDNMYLPNDKIDNNGIEGLLSRDFNFDEIELLQDIKIDKLIDSFFFKNKIRYIQYVNNNEKIRYGFMFEASIIKYNRIEKGHKRQTLDNMEINFFLELNKQTGFFSFHSGFFESHEPNIKIASLLVESEKEENLNKKILIVEKEYLITNAVNGKIIVEYKKGDME